MAATALSLSPSLQDSSKQDTKNSGLSTLSTLGFSTFTLSIASFFVLVFIQVSLALSFRAAQDESGKYPFDPAAVLVVAEILKFLLSLVLYSRSSNADKPEGWYVAFKSEVQSTPSLIWSCIALAVLYCANNNISFLLFQWMDGANINLFKSGSSFVSTLLLRFALQRGISSVQWAAVCLQVCGLAISQFGATGTNAPLLSLRSYVVLLISLTITSICSVYNDKVLKDHANIASLHTVNALLYAAGALLNGLVYLFSSSSTIARRSFFSGFDRPFTWIVLFFNTVIGIVVSAVYKYADATIKTFASACATSGLLLINILIYNQEFKIVVLLACITVFIATYLYATNPVAASIITEVKSYPERRVTNEVKGKMEELTIINEKRYELRKFYIFHKSDQIPYSICSLICFFTLLLMANGSGLFSSGGLVNANAIKHTHSHVTEIETEEFPSLPFNVTLHVPGASHELGAGNLALSSGRRIHSFRNAEFSLAAGVMGYLFVTVRVDKMISSPVLLNNKLEIADATTHNLLWQKNNSCDCPAHSLFVIDTMYDDAFIHWVLESAVYLSYWTELKGMFPNLKLVFRRPKKFKTLFLPAFGVSTDDVLYLTGGCPQTAPCEQAPPFPHAYPLPNLVFIPPGQYLHDGSLNMKLFHETLSAFVTNLIQFSQNLIEASDVRLDRSVLILPRGQKENYGPNDRSIPELNILASLVEEGNLLGAEVLRTDDLNDIRQQVNAVSRAKVIFLGAGSAAYFNMFFAANATIYVMGPDRIKFDSKFPYSREICALAGRKNEIIIRDDTIGKDELKALLMHHLAK